MKASMIGPVLIVALYVGLEAYAGHKARYRMEPDFILGQMVGAERAVERCGGATDAQLAAFTEVRERVEARFLRETAADASEGGTDAPAADLAEVTRRAIAVADSTVDAAGCDGPEAKAFVRRFGIYAGK